MTTEARPIAAPLAALLAMAAVWAAMPAEAAPPQAVTIETQIVFNPGLSGTFTATGPICASGTVESVRENQSAGFTFNTLVRFVCYDNSGSFVLHVQVQPNGQPNAARPRESFDLDGPWAVWREGGTGSYRTLTGYGWFGVVLDFSKDPLEADETYVGFVAP
jgi:hypothetical protein